MRQEATGSAARSAFRNHWLFSARGTASGRSIRWRGVALTLTGAACLCIAAAGVRADPQPLFRVQSLKLSAAIKRVEPVTCPGVAPSDMVRYPQRPGTPDPASIAPQMPVVLVVDDHNRRSRVRLDNGNMVVEPFGDCTLPSPIERPAQIDGSTVGVGTGYIAEAWLAVTSLKYRHGILGDVVTAAELRATNRRGDMLRYRLPDDAVFEDRLARMVYIDGQDAVLVVRSGLADGAALALFGLDRPAADAQGLVLLAASPPLGSPGLWLNPVGVGDFDGSGHSEIAAVLTPHQDGSLAVYQKQGAKLVQRYHVPGFSNHRKYSEELGMSAVVDANGDGIPDLAVPSADRQTLRVVTFAHGHFAELQSIPHTSDIVSAIVVQTLAPGGPSLVYALEDGTIVLLTK